MDEPSEMRQELMNRVEIVMNKACDYRNSFDGYTYLWVDDRQEFMRQVGWPEMGGRLAFGLSREGLIHPMNSVLHINHPV